MCMPFDSTTETRDSVDSLIETTLLYHARSIIEDPDRWTRNHLSTPDGRFCAIGALLEARRKRQASWQSYQRARAKLTRTAISYGWFGIEHLNDTAPHRLVLTAFDESIAWQGDDQCRLTAPNSSPKPRFARRA